MQKHRFGLLILATAALVGVTGCGGQSTSSSTQTQSTTAKPAAPARLGKLAYEKTMQKLGNELGKSVNGLYPIASGPAGSATEKATVAKLQSARQVVSNILAQMTAIIPPSQVAVQHKTIERGARELSAQLGALINDTQTGNLEAFAEGSSFTDSLDVITNAVDAMKARGYDVLGKQGTTAG